MLREVIVHLGGETHEIDDREVWVHLGESVANLRFNSRHTSLCLQYGGIQIVRAVFEGPKTHRVVLDTLRGGEEKGGRNLSRRTAILRILGDANDFKVSRIFLTEISEMFSDRVFIFEELLRECLVDDGDVARGGSILLGNRAAL